MKRFWIGLVILITTLGLGFWSMVAMNKAHTPIAEQLRHAAEAAQDGDWERAGSLTDQAKKEWEKQWYLSASFADHTDIDDIDAIFARLEVFLRQQELEDYAATSAQLSEEVKALEENHRLSWWNLL